MGIALGAVREIMHCTSNFALLGRALRVGVGAGVLALWFGTAWAQEPLPSREEMWRVIQMQQQQLEEQRQEIEALKRGQGALEESQAQTRQTAVESQQAASQAQATADSLLATTVTGMGAGAGSGWWDRTSLGGYGELHFEGGGRDQIDFHRFILFVGHEFNDNIRFFSELELEHAVAGDGKPGEIELEQAFIQFDLNDQHRLNAGLQLVPVGIINPIHEPPTFFGVDRNPLERNIIPTTWWEAGIGLEGNFGQSGFSYDLLVSSGLNVPVTGGNAFRIRSGRQKVAKAVAKAPAVTGRVRYTGVPGIEWAAAGHYQSDVTQETGDPLSGSDVSAFLFSTHVDARFGGFGFRALYASWWRDGATPDATGRNRQEGFYLEPSYRVPLMGAKLAVGEIGAFYRYSWWDNNAGMSTLRLATVQHAAGINYWPHPNVVFKMDYLWENPDLGAQTDRINLGVGYQF